jgi:2-amino-4-hydroxy-6-hydroxymethyldihydropteridine diphosphokinase
MSKLLLTNCAIGLGSNLGDSLAILDGAIDCLKSVGEIDILAVSSWISTKPVGPPQPDYLNGCVTISTCLAPLELLSCLQTIEHRFGRVRGEKWGARTLDLDLLLYGDRQIDLPQLQVPHPLMSARSFVLMPLAQIAPNWIDPISGKSIALLLSELASAPAELKSG